jgi:hypothetical protein
MAPVEPTIKGLIAALERLRELRMLADGLGGLDALPPARLRVLMVAAERQRSGELADLREARRLATLMAFAITAAERGQDDALEHFDRLHGDLLLRAAAAAKRERLRDGAAIDDAGRTLARACSVLLDDTITEPLRDVVFAAVARDRLAAAVTAIGVPVATARAAHCARNAPHGKAASCSVRSLGGRRQTMVPMNGSFARGRMVRPKSSGHGRCARVRRWLAALSILRRGDQLVRAR